MSSDIERVIQRDLDQLPLLPAERWVPRDRNASPGLAGNALRASAVLAMLAAAVIVGSAVARVRTEIVQQAVATASAAAASATAPGPAERISRQVALARIRGLSLVNPTIVRIEAKLVSRAVLQTADPNLAGPRMPSDAAWVVAVSGDVRCSFCLAPPAQPFRSALYLLDPRTGDVFATTASPDFWPQQFDALPDDALAANSQTVLAHVVEVREPDLLVVLTDFPAGPGTQLMLRADADTAFSWQAGIAGGNAFSLGELVRSNQIGPGGSVVRVTFDPQRGADGTLRLESLLTGPLTR
jgi:hypothetical protein